MCNAAQAPHFVFFKGGTTGSQRPPAAPSGLQRPPAAPSTLQRPPAPPKSPSPRAPRPRPYRLPGGPQRPPAAPSALQRLPNPGPQPPKPPESQVRPDAPSLGVWRPGSLGPNLKP